MHQFKDTWIDSLSAPRIPELHWRLLRKHNDALVSEIDTARVKNSSKRVLEVLGCRGVFQWWCRLSSTIANPDTHRYVVLIKNYPTLSSKLSNNWAVSYTIRLKVIKNTRFDEFQQITDAFCVYDESTRKPISPSLGTQEFISLYV